MDTTEHTEPPTHSDLISTDDAAPLLGLKSRNTVIRLVNAGELTGYRIGHALKVDRASVLAYLERARVKP